MKKMTIDPELEFYREQLRALGPEAVQTIRRALGQGSIEAALGLLEGATPKPHPHPVINSCRKECWAMLPMTPKIVESRLMAGDKRTARRLVHVRGKKATLTSAAKRLNDLGRADLIERARSLLLQGK